MKFLLLLSLFTMALTYQVRATEIEIIKEHSKINFDIDYMVVTKVQGQFKNYHGTLSINEDKGEIYNIKIIAFANSIDTNDGKRDFHLKGMEFFQAANYPEVLFESKGPFKISPQKKFNITGDLIIKGIKKTIALEGVYKGKLRDPWKKDNYFFELSGIINRKTYGMTWNKKLDNGSLLIGDQVNIKINVQAQATGDKTAFSTHMIPNTKGIIERDQLKKGLIKKLTTSTDPKDYPPKK